MIIMIFVKGLMVKLGEHRSMLLPGGNQQADQCE